MEAELVERIPEEEGWQYEPKWDGFRCLLFHDRGEVFLQSNAGQPLARYFPEVTNAAEKLNPKHWALDGELAVPLGTSFSFDHLLQRIHPAASRVAKLAKETPAIYIAFDLLMTEKEEVLLDSPLSERRKTLESFAKQFQRSKTLFLSPITLDIEQVRAWLKKTGDNLDGIVCKWRDNSYRSGVSSAFQKGKTLSQYRLCRGRLSLCEKKRPGRFRHGTRLLRWRPDKAPRQCRYNQLPKPTSNLRKLLQKNRMN